MKKIRLGKRQSIHPNGQAKVFRIGVPKSYHRDIVFYLLNGSWTQFFISLFSGFLVINLIFSAIYRIDHNAIANCDRFLDAFFFSVQTISTIGYGNMYPNSLFGHWVVTVEAAIGLLIIAMITGLTLTKASRAKAAVLFSNRLILSPRLGRMSLQCRLGNTKGNDVVDAKFGLSALIDETTPEGDTIRQIHTLALRRSESPFFFMTMVMIHVVDETSPLWQIDVHSPTSPLVSIVATISGSDATTGQPIHARHFYKPTDIEVNSRFADVIQSDPAGHFTIDYSQFHTTYPLDNTN